MLRHFVQTGLLINGRGEILHIYGRTGKYLESVTGEPAMNILPMSREGLQRAMTMALHKVVTKKEPVHCPGLQVRTNGDTIAANLTMRPVALESGEGLESDLYLVILEEAPPGRLEPSGKPGDEADALSAVTIDERISTLEKELQAKEEYLQTTLEEMETSKKSSNPPMRSCNRSTRNWPRSTPSCRRR